MSGNISLNLKRIPKELRMLPEMIKHDNTIEID
jgi:hypothetical protein